MSGSVGWAAAAGVLFVQNGARQYFSYFPRTYHLNHSNCLIKKKLKRKISPSLINIYLCRAMITKGMVFRYTWVYSKEDTMAHTRRLVVTS